MTTPQEPRSVVASILSGDHDDNLREIAEAVDQRERALSPSDAVQMLGRVFAAIAEHVDKPAQQRAQLGAELHHVLKRLADDPNENVRALIASARTDVLVKLMDVPREHAEQMEQAGLAEPPSPVE